MTSPDRTDELIRAMLALRAGGQPPADLVGRTLLALAAAPRREGADHRAVAPRAGQRRRPWLAAGLVVAILALVVAGARSWTARRGASRRQRSRDGGRSHGGAIDHAGRLGGRGEPGSVRGNASLHG